MTVCKFLIPLNMVLYSECHVLDQLHYVYFESGVRTAYERFHDFAFFTLPMFFSLSAVFFHY